MILKKQSKKKGNNKINKLNSIILNIPNFTNQMNLRNKMGGLDGRIIRRRLRNMKQEIEDEKRKINLIEKNKINSSKINTSFVKKVNKPNFSTSEIENKLINLKRRMRRGIKLR